MSGSNDLYSFHWYESVPAIFQFWSEMAIKPLGKRFIICLAQGYTHTYSMFVFVGSCCNKQKCNNIKDRNNMMWFGSGVKMSGIFMAGNTFCFVWEGRKIALFKLPMENRKMFSAMQVTWIQTNFDADNNNKQIIIKWKTFLFENKDIAIEQQQRRQRYITNVMMSILLSSSNFKSFWIFDMVNSLCNGTNKKMFFKFKAIVKYHCVFSLLNVI